MKPTYGYTLVVEDKTGLKEDSMLKAQGFTVDEKNAGVTGVVYATSIWNPFSKIREGKRVAFSKFAAEQLDDVEINGEKIDNLRSIPNEAILATI